MDKLTDVKKYRDTMCPECRNDVKLLGAILKVQDISLELIKNERELIKTIKEINKNNPNRQATEKERYAFAEARNPQIFQETENLKRKLVGAHRELADIKIAKKCVNKFSHDCSPDSCQGTETCKWPE